MNRKRIAILTGAGISAESGIKTFRDADGLWEGHDVMEVASPQGFTKNPELVLRFYNDRRRQLKEVMPNKAHLAIKELESQYDVTVITQNVDNLHERAGSNHIIHLHGRLDQVRCTRHETEVMDWTDDLNIGDMSTTGHQLRPHIVWFGEAVPMIEKAVAVMQDVDISIIIGTSMQVYPAAGLIGYVSPDCKVYYVDPKPHISYELSQSKNLEIIKEKATVGVEALVQQLLQEQSA